MLYTEQTCYVCPLLDEVSRDSFQRKASIPMRRTCSPVDSVCDLITVCIRFDSGHVLSLFFFLFLFNLSIRPKGEGEGEGQNKKTGKNRDSGHVAE